MIFPAWGAGEGAIYRVDNVKIYDPTAVTGVNTLFAEAPASGWALWDCCGGTTPALVADDTAHGVTAEFSIGAQPTVMGIIAREEFVENPAPVDASAMLTNGVVQFEMKVTSMPGSAAWMLKIEANNNATFAEMPLTDSVEGAAPVSGEWQTYTFTLQQLFDAGLDISGIDVVMVFPAWGEGEGAVYRLDNMMIYEPTN